MEIQETHPQPKNPYTIPIAIIIAGFFIALALFYTSSDNTQVIKKKTEKITSPTTLINISLDPVTKEDHVLGNPNAGIIIVEYSDTECPYCKNFHTTMHRIIDLYGKEGEVAWVYRHFPIESLHSKAPREAEATECATEPAGNTGFWKYIDLLYSRTPSNNQLKDSELSKIGEDIGLNKDTFLLCLDSGKYKEKIQAGIKSAKKAGGRGTPYNIIVLQKKLNSNTQDSILSAAAKFPPKTVLISNDGKKMSLNGALPFDFMKLLIGKIIDNNK